MANLYEILSYRQLSDRESMQRRIWSHLHCHESFVESLCYSCQLEGHRGCVNCLQWNTDGSLLASGSDDLTTVLWDPYQKKAAATVQTGHTGNIFSVKFLPFSGDKHLLTGSEDGEVRLHDLTTFDTTRVWGCCRGRVKRVATSPQSPFYCWSASEDGCVRRLDTREPHSCTGSGMCRNIIIDLRAHSRLSSINQSFECKCIDINPVRSEQIAVGALDQYARIYDTRLCSFQALNSLRSGTSGDPSCIACFSPGHMNHSYTRPMKKHSCNTVATTYLNFSSDGQELLVNLSGEQVYLYSISNHLPPILYEFDKSDSTSVPRLKPSVRTTRKHIQTIDGIGTKLLACVSEPYSIPEMGMEEEDVGKEVVRLRNIGKDLYKKEQLDESLQYLNMAISRCPNWYVLYFLRGTTLYSRKWSGDVYAALRDIETSLSLHPTHRLSKQRRIQCLMDLGLKDEVFRFLDDYSYQYPHDTKFTEKTRLELEEEAHKDGPSSAPNGSTSCHHTTNGRSLFTPNQSSQYALVCDYTSRYCGHCNTHTDIKEAIFLGDRNNYIAAGSDDGNIFIWDRYSTNLVRVLRGDSSIINCVQWHPTTCMLASSGIENVVRLWEPWKEEPELESDTRVVSDMMKVSKENQHRMRVDPFEVMLMRMGFAMVERAVDGGEHHHQGLHVNDEEGQDARPRGSRGGGREDGEGERGEREGSDLGWIENPANCRQS